MRDAKTLLAGVRAKYPGAYDDIDDATLLAAVKKKYPGDYDDVTLEAVPSTKSAGINIPLGKAESISTGYKYVPGIGQIPSGAIGMGKEALRMAPEFGGQALGGIAGAAIGGPPGAIAGAAGGGVAGQGITQVLARMFPSFFKGTEMEAPKSSQEALGRMLTSGIWSGVGEATGQLGGKMLPKLTTRKPVSAPVQAAITTLEKEGVPVTPGNIRPLGTMHMLENLSRGSLFGGRIMEEFDIEQAKKLYGFKNRLLEKLGPEIERTQLGQEIKNSVETRVEDLKGIFERFYGQMSGLYQAPIDNRMIRSGGQKILKEIDELIKTGRMTAANPKEAPSRFRGLAENLANYGIGEAPPQFTLDQFGRKIPVPRQGPPQIVELPTTYSDVWKSKQLIDQVMRSTFDDPLTSTGKATAQKLHNILDEAMIDAANRFDKTGKAAIKIKNLNTGYAKYKELMETESAVARMRRGDYDPEKVVDSFFKSDSITPVKELLRAIPPRDKSKMLEKIRRRTIEKLFEPHTKTVEGVEVMSAVNAEKTFKKNMETLKTYFTREQLNGIQEFLEASKVAQSAGRMVNPASGRQAVAYGELGVLGGAIPAALAGFPGVAATGIAGILTPRVIAKIVMNPKGAKILSQGLRMSETQARRIGFLPKLANLIRLNMEATEEEPAPRVYGPQQ